MPNNDPIIWKNLFPNQRNALIAEHIFGRTIINWKPGRDLLMAREDNPRLSEAIPAYTESMDAAWCVLQKMISEDEPHRFKFASKFASAGDALSFVEDTQVIEIIEAVADWTPAEICIAALRAHGLIIDIDAEKTVEEVRVKPKSVDMS